MDILYKKLDHRKVKCDLWKSLHSKYKYNNKNNITSCRYNMIIRTTTYWCCVCVCYLWLYRSQWPRGPRRRSAGSRPLRLWVRIPPGAWEFFCCEFCVFSGRGLCDKLITRREESYRLWCVVVCDLETSWMKGLLAKNKQNLWLYFCKQVVAYIGERDCPLWPVTDVFQVKIIRLKCCRVSWVWGFTVIFFNVLCG